MEEKEVLSLIDKFDRSTLSKLSYENNGVILKMEKNTVVSEHLQGNKSDSNNITAKETDTSAECEEIISPLVGVLYSAPSPDGEPFVKEGQMINKGDIVCLVEAMKMINEIKSPYNGKINKIKVKNGEVVSYNQSLFEVEKC
ncbi:MAG: biotin/lipoyl-containing protein [Oscillospiraceae bacterium]